MTITPRPSGSVPGSQVTNLAPLRSRSSSPNTTPIYTPSESSTSTHPTTNLPTRRPSPLHLALPGARAPRGGAYNPSVPYRAPSPLRTTTFPDSGPSDDEDDDLDSLMSDSSRPPMHRPTDGRSGQPLLKDERGRSPHTTHGSSGRPPFSARRSTFRSQSPGFASQNTTRRKYTYAAFFLGLSLVSFVIQTETASYIQRELGWNKAYCMLYLTHGSWSLLWPITILMLRVQKRRMPWKVFWRRHLHLVRTTAQMVRTQKLDVTGMKAQESPVAYMLKTTAFVAIALTIAGGSWYVAVDMTSPSDLTAIYNCSAFFAYAFSIPLLGDKFRFDKIFSVLVAIAGVLIVVYGDAGPVKQGGTSGGGTEGDIEAKNRTAGNLIIGVGSVLYGLYEVLYKRLACPPEGTSPGRGMIFAMTFGTLIGTFTLAVLWIPLPILHYTQLETFEVPVGEQAWLLLISVLANAVFSGSFLILISLTSPVLSSVAALLTIFLVAIVDWALPGGKPLSFAAFLGGGLIVAAFLLLSWSTYREMDEERIKRAETDEVAESDIEDEPLD